MSIKSSILFITLFLVDLFFSQRNRGREHSSNDFVNVKVDRLIDLSYSIIQIKSEILIKSMKVDPIYSYKFPILKNSSKYMINLNAKLKSLASEEKEDIISLKVTKQSTPSTDEYDYYEVNFKSEPMNYEEERVLIITEDYFEKLDLLPKKIQLKDDQLVVFQDSLNHVSYYQTNSQKIHIKLPSERTEIVENSKSNGTRKKDNLYYEINEPSLPLHSERIRLHYIYNEAIVVFNYAHRTYEVSHWGNIAVEDKYQIENIGALLEGEFGRVDYDDYGRYGGKNALRKLRARLPLKSFGLWYRDEIGNVSTSKAAREWEDVRLDLTPRFPILGGWKSNFFIGYNLPSKFHVSTNGQDLYTLNVTFGLPYSDVLAKNYTSKIILPEGASDIKINLPIDSKYTISHEKSFSTLDMFGRPTIVIKMKNCYDIHKVTFAIQYKYSNFNLFFKPLLVILFFFAMFIALIAYFRITLSFSKIKSKDE